MHRFLLAIILLLTISPVVAQTIKVDAHQDLDLSSTSFIESIDYSNDDMIVHFVDREDKQNYLFDNTFAIYNEELNLKKRIDIAGIIQSYINTTNGFYVLYYLKEDDDYVVKIAKFSEGA